jgi:hypothetical protein
MIPVYFVMSRPPIFHRQLPAAGTSGTSQSALEAKDYSLGDSYGHMVGFSKQKLPT